MTTYMNVHGQVSAPCSAQHFYISSYYFSVTTIAFSLQCLVTAFAERCSARGEIFISPSGSSGMNESVVVVSPQPIALYCFRPLMKKISNFSRLVQGIAVKPPFAIYSGWFWSWTGRTSYILTIQWVYQQILCSMRSILKPPLRGNLEDLANLIFFFFFFFFFFCFF